MSLECSHHLFGKYAKPGRRAALALHVLLAAMMSAVIGGQTSDYVLGAQDVLAVTLRDRPEFSGEYVLQNDGTFAFPLVGTIAAGGRTVSAVETELRNRLADGYFKNPQILVAIHQHRSQRIFVVGEVEKPGNYPLSGDTTLLQVLTLAGPLSVNAGDEVIVVRPKADRLAQGPVLPADGSGAEVSRVDLEKLQSGQLVEDLPLHNGDTIFIPKAEHVFVFGQVKSPGSYPVRKQTTVLQALSLAGGLSDRGSTNRIKVVRIVDGKEKEVRVKLNDLLQPNDTIIVPERWF
ncbi:MAG: hypothetical protein GEU82_06995 [Luteitalea sp.]|nr:hypothetical protein [Luteitalea sp.]